ncbi:hypothetical protein [Variovorax boronicumulans]
MGIFDALHPHSPRLDVIPSRQSAHDSHDPTVLTKAFADICKDTGGFDRAAFHEQWNAKVLAFFKRHLGSASKLEPRKAQIRMSTIPTTGETRVAVLVDCDNVLSDMRCFRLRMEGS